MSAFEIGSRFRLIAQPFDIGPERQPVGEEGVILRPSDYSTYQWVVQMDSGRRWHLQEVVMENLTRPAIVNDITKALGL